MGANSLSVLATLNDYERMVEQYATVFREAWLSGRPLQGSLRVTDSISGGHEMCGIFGVISNSHRIGPEQLDQLNDTMFKRGPDGRGAFWDGKVGLAMRRLAIIDIAGGAQPMYSEDEQVVVVMNGEIYNHARLRDELISAGHRFTSRAEAPKSWSTGTSGGVSMGCLTVSMACSRSCTPTARAARCTWPGTASERNPYTWPGTTT